MNELGQSVTDYYVYSSRPNYYAILTKIIHFLYFIFWDDNSLSIKNYAVMIRLFFLIVVQKEYSVLTSWWPVFVTILRFALFVFERFQAARQIYKSTCADCFRK